MNSASVQVADISTVYYYMNVFLKEDSLKASVFLENTEHLSGIT
jgi:hypothetical protein